MTKHFERTGIKELKNLKLSLLTVQERESRRARLERDKAIYISREKGKVLAEKALSNTVDGTPNFIREINRTTKMITFYKEEFGQELIQSDNHNGFENFVLLCDSYINYVNEYGSCFDFLSLRNFRHTIERELLKYFNIYCGEISGPVMMLG